MVVDTAKLQQTLEAYEKVRTLLEDGGLTLREALALQLSLTKQLGDEHAGVDVGVSYGTWLEDITRKLLNPQLVTVVAPATNFRATLRPYQQAGLNWLGFLDSLGFGACLADDMGLGKTIELLAFLSVKKQQQTTSLLVVPASLIANWRNEIDRFYPRTRLLHRASWEYARLPAGGLVRSRLGAVRSGHDHLCHGATLRRAADLSLGLRYS